MTTIIKNFRSIRPKYEQKQEEILRWIAKAHSKAEKQEVGSLFHEELSLKLSKIGLGSQKIQYRGMQMKDCFHDKWEEMDVYNLEKNPKGGTFQERMAFFTKSVDTIFDTLYPIDFPIPPHLIHVTCTGYVSPSGAQKIISQRGYGKKTSVSHAYHMGCYAAIPALRIAEGLLPHKNNVDIVHTEMCTLHMNPLLHTTEQLVVQSLFGDGFISYSVSSEKGPGFKLLNLQEEILTHTDHAMEWGCEDWGMKMHISREVPFLIAHSLPSFVKTLTGLYELDNIYFAIHPGGPKIIEQVAKILCLESFQIAHSKYVMQLYGNMSSATLPHIWEKMWEDPAIEDGALIISLAFGPGLTLCGGVFQCCRS